MSADQRADDGMRSSLRFFAMMPASFELSVLS